MPKSLEYEIARHEPAAAVLTTMFETPEMRNPACGGVSSVRVRLPATGADLLGGGACTGPAFVHERIVEALITVNKCRNPYLLRQPRINGKQLA